MLATFQNWWRGASPKEANTSASSSNTSNMFEDEHNIINELLEEIENNTISVDMTTAPNVVTYFVNHYANFKIDESQKLKLLLVLYKTCKSERELLKPLIQKIAINGVTITEIQGPKKDAARYGLISLINLEIKKSVLNLEKLIAYFTATANEIMVIRKNRSIAKHMTFLGHPVTDILFDEGLGYFIENAKIFENIDELTKNISAATLNALFILFPFTNKKGMLITEEYIKNLKIKGFTLEELIHPIDIIAFLDHYIRIDDFREYLAEDIIKTATERAAKKENTESNLDLITQQLNTLHITTTPPPAPPPLLFHAASSSQPGPGIPPPPPPPLSSSTRVSNITPLRGLSANEQKEWLTSTTGLNLKTLSFIPVYPEDNLALVDFQLAVGFSDHGKPISNDKPEHQEKARNYFESKIQEYFFEIIQFDPALTAKLIETIDSKAPKWKKGSPNAIDEIFKFLSLEIHKLRKQRIKQTLLSTDDDQFNDALLRSKRINKRFKTTYDQFKNADEAIKPTIAAELNAIITELADTKKTIRHNNDVLSECKAALIRFHAERSNKINPINLRLTEISERLENLKDRLAPEIDIYGRNKKLFDNLKNEFNRKTVEREQLQQSFIDSEQELQSLINHHDLNQEKQWKIEVIQDLFLPTELMEQFQKQERTLSRQPSHSQLTRSSSSSGSSSSIDRTCMGNDPAQRQFDIQFFNVTELSRLAHFFETYEDEFAVPEKDEVYKLMLRINTILNQSSATFNQIIDVACGRIQRRIEGFCSLMARKVFSENTETNPQITADYAHYIDRNEAHTAENRGISKKPKGSARAKFFEYTRTLEADYLFESQFENLAKFFSKNSSDLRKTDGKVDQEAVVSRINKLLDETNLSANDIIDVATGYKFRKPGSFASEHHFKMMLTDDIRTREGPAPDYANIVEKQRTESRQIRAEEMRKKASFLRSAP